MSLPDVLARLSPGSPDAALARQIDGDRLPAHVAIIMDGNGRWAAQRHLPRVEGHRAGIDSVRDAVETAARLGIQVLTLYAFSIENWKRPRTEVSALMSLLRRYLRSELHMLMEHGIRFRVVGRKDALAKDIQKELTEAALYSTARLSLETSSTAPTMACMPTAFSLARFTTSLISRERVTYVETPAYGETVVQRATVSVLLASRSRPATSTPTSSGP